MLGNWERVGKGSKPKTKNQKARESEKMLKQSAEAAPLPVESMFDAIDEKQKTAAGNQKLPFKDRSNIQGSPNANKKPKKPKKPSPASNFKHSHFKDAICEVSVLEMYKQANSLRNGQKVWQKDVANLINEKISCPEESPAFLERDFSYPSSKLSKAVKDMLKKLFVEETSDAVRQLLFDHFIRTLKECTAKDMPTWGYRLCVQALAHNVPDACTTDLERHYNEILTMKNFPKRCLTILWTLGQTGVGSVRSGMQVWLEVMMPLLGVKNLAQYAVHYLETLFSSTKNPQRDLEGSIDADHFAEILKWTFDSSNGLSASLRDRLREMYGTIRIIATANPPLKLAVFEKFLRAPASEISRSKAPFIEVAFECLKENPKCFESWRGSYLSSLPQTKLLLEHIDGKWEEYAEKIPSKFESTIRYFHSENSNAAAQSFQTTSIPEFKGVKDVCLKVLQKFEKRVRQRQSRCGGIFFSVSVALLAVSLGIFLYDANLHGGIYKSTSYRKLESSGTLKYLKLAWKWTSTIFRRVNEWLQRNIPYYWSVASDAFGPYIAYVGSILSEFLTWIMKIAEHVGGLIVGCVKSVLVWTDALFHKMIPFMSDAYATLRPYLLIFYGWLEAKVMTILSFVRGEIGWCCIRDAIVENTMFLYRIFGDAFAFAWRYVIHLGKLASDYISGENM